MDKFTIKDIAKLSDVSTATVSNYLNNNYAKMSEKTKQRLATVIEKTNYRPSTTARNLAKNENKTIGVSVADITNPFTSPVISGISDRCSEYGYKLVFTNSNNDEQKEIENINRLLEEEVAGLIIDPVNPNSNIYNMLSNTYTVIVDRQAQRNIIDTITTDNIKSVEVMTQKMLDAGYTDLYFVTWPLSGISTRIDRYTGFKNATKYTNDDHLLTIPYNYEPTSDDHFMQAIRQIVNTHDKPGFFTMNSRVLQNFLQTTQSLGYTYPDNFGVATYENFDWMQLMTPGISCISQDSVVIGYTAMDLLKEKLTTDYTSEPNPIIKTIPTDIIIRDSF